MQNIENNIHFMTSGTRNNTDQYVDFLSRGIIQNSAKDFGRFPVPNQPSW